MNTNHLMSFMVLADTHSYQKAASQLHYSRSTVADHIHALEQELGSSLTYTSGRSVLLTASGERFLPHARSILEACQAAVIDTIESQDNPALRIITIETLGLYFLNLPLTRLVAVYPDINLSIQYVPFHKMQEMLLEGKADIAFQFSGHAWDTVPAAGLKKIRICRDEAIFFTNPDSGLKEISEESVPLKSIAESRFILTNRGGIYSTHLASIFRDTGIRIVPKQYIDSGTLLKQFVMSNDCVSMLSRRVIEKELLSGGLIRLNVPVSPMLSNVMALYPASGDANPALKKLIQIAILCLDHPQEADEEQQHN